MIVQRWERMAPSIRPQIQWWDHGLCCHNRYVSHHEDYCCFFGFWQQFEFRKVVQAEEWKSYVPFWELTLASQVNFWRSQFTCEIEVEIETGPKLEIGLFALEHLGYSASYVYMHKQTLYRERMNLNTLRSSPAVTYLEAWIGQSQWQYNGSWCHCWKEITHRSLRFCASGIANQAFGIRQPLLCNRCLHA